MTNRIETETPILPFSVAHDVVEEVERYRQAQLPKRSWYLDQLVERAEHQFANNQDFYQRMVAGTEESKDFLFLMMRAWLTMLLKDNHPLIFKGLPHSFHIGLPIAG